MEIPFLTKSEKKVLDWLLRQKEDIRVTLLPWNKYSLISYSFLFTFNHYHSIHCFFRMSISSTKMSFQKYIPSKLTKPVKVSLLAIATVLSFSCVLYLFPQQHSQLYNKIASSSRNYYPSNSMSKGGNYGNDVVDSSDPSVNSTLGFEKVLYMNLWNRWDLDDTIVLQSAITGIDMEKVDAIPLADLSPVGMPPGPKKSYEKMGVVSCFETHAVLWKKMMANNWNTLLIFEADAAWDVEIKKQMGRFSEGLYQLLVKLGKIDASEKPTNEDPYLSKHWDLIQLGGCFENSKGKEDSIVYSDPYAQRNQKWVDGSAIEEGTRRMRYRGEQMCTNSYAITRSGAEKLLLRSAIDFDTPVDGVIAELVREGKIEQFNAVPMPVVQWEYIRELSANEKNSDIGSIDNDAYKISNDQKATAWAKAKENMNIWTYNGMHGSFKFQKGALFTLKKTIFGL